jgi:hypothetical protein
MKEKCELCRFFVPLPGDEMGFCHRYPPTLGQTDRYVRSQQWPCVYTRDWCGEFKKPELWEQP